MPKQQSCFIEQLYQAIQKQRSSTVDWDPNGKGFIVGNLTQFTNRILSRQFNIGRLDSFARKLNRHGFKRSKIDKSKIRFFHKYFNRQSKNLHKIKKLSKYESLPKHIKLKMIRDQIINKNNQTVKQYVDIVNEIYENNLAEGATANGVAPGVKIEGTGTAKIGKGNGVEGVGSGGLAGCTVFDTLTALQTYSNLQPKQILYPNREDPDDDDILSLGPKYLLNQKQVKHEQKDELKIQSNFLSTPKSIRFDFRSDNEDAIEGDADGDAEHEHEHEHERERLKLYRNQVPIQKGICQFLDDSDGYDR